MLQSRNIFRLNYKKNVLVWASVLWLIFHSSTYHNNLIKCWLILHIPIFEYFLTRKKSFNYFYFHRYTLTPWRIGNQSIQFTSSYPVYWFNSVTYLLGYPHKPRIKGGSSRGRKTNRISPFEALRIWRRQWLRQMTPIRLDLFRQVYRVSRYLWTGKMEQQNFRGK